MSHIYAYLKKFYFYGSIKAFLFRCAFLYDAEFGIAAQNITQKNRNSHFSKIFEIILGNEIDRFLWNHHLWFIEQTYRAIFSINLHFHSSFFNFIDHFSRSWGSQETCLEHLKVYPCPTISDASKTCHFSISDLNSPISLLLPITHSFLNAII